MTLLIFWNLPCEAYQQAFLEIKRLYRRVNPKQLEVWMVCSKNPAKVTKYLRWKKLPFPCGYDSTEEVFESYVVKEVPTFYVMDDECNLLQRWVGYDEDTLLAIKKLMWKYRKKEG